MDAMLRFWLLEELHHSRDGDKTGLFIYGSSGITCKEVQSFDPAVPAIVCRFMGYVEGMMLVPVFFLRVDTVEECNLARKIVGNRHVLKNTNRTARNNPVTVNSDP